MKAKRLIAIVAVCLMGWAAHGQNGFNMPYSQFGIGNSDMPYNLPMMARTGGAALTRAGNNAINPFNPASYASIEMESFVFDMGVNLQISTLRDDNKSLRDADGNIGYLMIGLPITRWWKVAAGLMPYSTVDYESTHTSQHPGVGTVKTVYDGTGGVNQVFVGSAFNIINDNVHRRHLQAGFNVNYFTGNIHRAISYSFPGNDTTYYMNGRTYKHTRISNVLLDLGVQYRQAIGENYTLGLALTYKPGLKMKVDDEALGYTYHTSDESLVDTVFPARGVDAAFESDLKQAHTFGLGVSFERNLQWAVAVDAEWGQWKGMLYEENPDYGIFGKSALRSGPYSRYAIGLERLGNMDAATYWGRIGWSLGGHTEQGVMRLMLNGTEQVVNEWGIGAGASLPMRKGKSLLTLSIDYRSIGKRELLQRNILTFGIAVSSCERWFVKRQYN